MSDDIHRAPGRSALWTQAALAALTGAAAPTIVSNNEGEEEFDLDHDAIVADAIAIADKFERVCIERHEREQAAKETLADLPAVAPDALPTVPGMADADARLRAAMAERGKTAG